MPAVSKSFAHRRYARSRPEAFELVLDPFKLTPVVPGVKEGGMLLDHHGAARGGQSPVDRELLADLGSLLGVPRRPRSCWADLRRDPGQRRGELILDRLLRPPMLSSPLPPQQGTETDNQQDVDGRRESPVQAPGGQVIASRPLGDQHHRRGRHQSATRESKPAPTRRRGPGLRSHSCVLKPLMVWARRGRYLPRSLLYGCCTGSGGSSSVSSRSELWRARSLRCLDQKVDMKGCPSLRGE